MPNDHLARRRFLQASAVLAAAPLAAPASPAPQSAARPRLVFNVRDFGAAGDGKAKDTAAIQQDIDRCSVFGGGEVLFPGGEYFTGAVALRSNTLLRLDKDAAILGSPDFTDYPVSQVRWEGKWIPGRVGLIYAIDASHIGISPAPAGSSAIPSSEGAAPEGTVTASTSIRASGSASTAATSRRATTESRSSRDAAARPTR